MKYIKTYESKESDEIEDFIDYIIEFYGERWQSKPSLFATKITRKVIKRYVYDYVSKRKRLGVWGPGDSFDREIFRDLLRFKLGFAKLSELEYNLRPYISDIEFDADRYNL